MPTGIQQISKERRRQVEKEKFTKRHDDQYHDDELIRAAIAYCENSVAPLKKGYTPLMWPWGGDYWKPKDRRANLVRAGALIAAELDRLDRECLRNSK